MSLWQDAQGVSHGQPGSARILSEVREESSGVRDVFAPLSGRLPLRSALDKRMKTGPARFRGFQPRRPFVLMESADIWTFVGVSQYDKG